MAEPPDTPAVTLPELRKRLGMSQTEIAAAVGTTQSGVSRTERQTDMHISTLGEYVGALGGRLRLIAEHPDGRTEIRIPSLQRKRPARRREFRVIWQDQSTRSLVHVGWLGVHRGGVRVLIHRTGPLVTPGSGPSRDSRSPKRPTGRVSCSRSSLCGSPAPRTPSTRPCLTRSASTVMKRLRRSCWHGCPNHRMTPSK